MSPPPQASVNVDENISKLQDKIDDLENRSRRSNVLFFGVTDTDESETGAIRIVWHLSELLNLNDGRPVDGLLELVVVSLERLGPREVDAPGRWIQSASVRLTPSPQEVAETV
ncbi:hypothetical protein HPB47_020986 [Ixodes persulcatus]|uniref:Uncharacterized protein n=1 Tax=Ixodes persulcatus TaxID=34615 RepID=A0AC60QDY9_IXOPE|nr:hypothetical protein HPB47_020986 [Ixodes persulcatus]